MKTWLLIILSASILAPTAFFTLTGYHAANQRVNGLLMMLNGIGEMLSPFALIYLVMQAMKEKKN